MNKFFIISFMSTNFSRLKRHWYKHDRLHKRGILGTDQKHPPFLGGKVVILDWVKKKIIWDLNVDIPTGIDFSENNNLLFINSLKNEILGVSGSKKVQFKLTNSKFNSLHSILYRNNTFLVTSSGLDLILEIDVYGNSLFEWWATDNGFGFDQFRKRRKINKLLDHSRKSYPTLFQATHINSATNDGNNFILATLFHQGFLLRINKKTGKHKVVLRELSKPHGIHKIDRNRYILSDTGGNRVIFLNKNFSIVHELKKDFCWVQDAILTIDDSVLVADADNNRLVRVNTSKIKSRIVDIFKFSKEWRIFQVKEISRDFLRNFIK
ncbi:hypothetical protein C4553_00550 [Candidatus Parcubacteria bacterium]|nr:MAG: hypothetical protein C4553_00550 [Candidatus Parcubacteria bacterium]